MGPLHRIGRSGSGQFPTEWTERMTTNVSGAANSRFGDVRVLLEMLEAIDPDRAAAICDALTDEAKPIHPDEWPKRLFREAAAAKKEQRLEARRSAEVWAAESLKYWVCA